MVGQRSRVRGWGGNSIDKILCPNLCPSSWQICFFEKDTCINCHFWNIFILILHEEFGHKLGPKLGHKILSIELTPCITRSSATDSPPRLRGSFHVPSNIICYAAAGVVNLYRFRTCSTHWTEILNGHLASSSVNWRGWWQRADWPTGCN